MIEIGKKYRTTCGKKVRRILCVDRKSNFGYCVVAEMECGGIHCFNKDGSDLMGAYLVEVSPYEDFKIDDPVMVRRSTSKEWFRRYFAGVSPEGNPMTWVDGRTSWSVVGTIGGLKFIWDECRRPTPEELRGAA